MPVPIRRTLVTATLLAASVGLAGCTTDAAEPGSTTASEPGSAGSSGEPTPEATDGQPITNGPNSLLTPGDGATVSGPTVTVTGDGTAFEGTLVYEVTDASSGVVDQGYTQAGANGEIGPYEFELTLDPGTYTVRVWEPAMGEEESGDPVNEVSATFTVS
ncbi:MAG: Gmad2 immunoglobulin-like domain-containing protein [Actinomycetales bacterium]|nr:Gmad2 immunoglobulin-like domain-containing protein [Actinomycetales bacterium]